MSLGYCQVSTVGLNPSANDRQLVNSSLPSRIKLVGFTVGRSLVSYTSTANIVHRFKLFDGPSVSDPFWTIPFFAPSVATLAFSPSLFTITDDSYLDVENGLSYEVTTADLSSVSYPLMVNVFYIG